VASIGLYNHKARYYDPYITHFLQPDTIVPDLNNPQSLNRYAYALNNPIRYNDPSGHTACGDLDNPYARAYCESQGGVLGFGDDSNYVNNTPAPQAPSPQSGVPSTNGGSSAPTLPIPTFGNSGNGNNCSTNDLNCQLGPKNNRINPNPAQDKHKPNWGKIAEGVGILFVADVLVVLPLAAGIALAPGGLEVSMLLSEAWVYPLVAAVVAVNVYGWNLIVEGARGQ
jgi:RHS repeat-associated protein